LSDYPRVFRHAKEKRLVMAIPDMRTETSVLALVRSHDQTFPLLPIRPLNSITYTRMLLGDLGPTKTYELIKLGLLDARKLGSQTRITGESIKAFIASLPKGVAGSPQPEGRRQGGSAVLQPTADCDAKNAPSPNPTD
jgi:hypothetical protein